MSYRAHELAEIVVAVTEAPLIDNNFRRIRELSSRLTTHEDIAYLTIMHGDDNVVAHHRNPDSNEQGITVATESIQADGEIIGTVSLGYRNHYADNMASPIGRFVIFGTIGIGILAIVTIYLQIVAITRPLRKLHEVGTNGEHSKFKVFFNDEIEQTINMVNALRERMDNSYSKLQTSLRDQQLSVHESKAIEERNHAIYEASLDAIVVADDQDNIIEFSPLAEMLFGWERDEVLGRRLADTIVPEQMRAQHIAGMQHFLKSGEGPVLDQRLELTAIRRSGREFPVEISISAAKTRDGHIFVSYIRDISKQKRNEEKRKLFKYAFEHSPPSLIADGKGHITQANPAFSELTGYRSEDVSGEKPRMLTDNPDDKQFHKRIWLSLLSHRQWDGVLNLRHREGAVIPVKVHMSAHMSEQGELLHYCAYFHPLESAEELTLTEPMAQTKQSPH